MEIWLWSLCVVLLLIILFLSVKLYLMQKSAEEIDAAFADRLTTDTNTLIDLSSRDRHMRKLASDINTQLRRLRQERRRFYEGDRELKEAVTNISHDLRTPLTAICGYLDLLEQEEKSEAAARYLEMIKNRTDLLKQLTEELFRYSVISSSHEEKREWISVNHVLEESLASYYGAMKQKNMIPVISIPDQQVERYLDRSALIRIFGNILSNALKYSDGDLNVSMDESGTIIFSNSAHSLTPVIAGRLFDRFYTLETGRNSTGLGLSIAKVLTERMNGAITADYHDNTLFLTLSFPNNGKNGYFY